MPLVAIAAAAVLGEAPGAHHRPDDWEAPVGEPEPVARALTPPSAAPDLRPRPLRIAVLDDLHALEPDPLVEDRVERLAARRGAAKVALALAAGGLTIGVARAAGEWLDTEASKAFCFAPGGCHVTADYGPALRALAASAGFALLGLALRPGERDLQEVVALWNSRNPQAPAELVPR